MNLVVIFYPANIIDYIRLLLLIVSIFCKGNVFAVLHALNISLDYADGKMAKLRNETSILGAALDMIIDRVSTLVILMKISLVKPNLSSACMLYSVVDFISHFLFFLVAAYTGISHKVFSDSFLLSWYYFTPILAVLCIGSELCFIMNYLIKKKNILSTWLIWLAGIKTFFHAVHFFVAVDKLSDISSLGSK